MKYLTLLLSVVSTSTLAGLEWVDLHVGSVHTQQEFEYHGEHYKTNGFNYGLGFTYVPEDKEKPDVRFGGFNNSYNDPSFYLGLNPHSSYDEGHWAVGAVFGVITGYQNGPMNRAVMPMVVPHLTYLFDNASYRAELSFLYGHETSALGLTFGKRF